jgi:pyocin large subunit-like protein
MIGTRMKVLAMGATLLALSACDNGPSAVAPQQAAGTQMAEAANDTPAATKSAQADHRKDPVKLVDGKPMWSASRKFSAEQNAERAFTRNGEAFGADTLDEFVDKAHAFVEAPPKGTLTYVRGNGDKLFYDPKGNVFAVATKDGAPRTMFKPDEGRAYWDEQMTREERRKTARAKKDDEAA